MKILLFCGLMTAFLTVANSRTSIAQSGAGAVTNLTEYVFLHKTRGEGVSFEVVANANMCLE